MCRRRLLKSNFYINYGGTKKAHGETVIVSPFVAGGDSDTFELYARNPWVIANNLSWLDVSSLSNKSGKYTITIAAAENQAYSERSGSFTAKTLDDRFSVVISVSQQAKPSVRYIEIVPATASISSLGTTSFTCILHDNGTETDVTNLVEWSSSDTNAATISNGSATGCNNTKTEKQVTITAEYDGLSATATLNVAAGAVSWRNYRILIGASENTKNTPVNLDATNITNGVGVGAYIDEYVNEVKLQTWAFTEGSDWSIGDDSVARLEKVSEGSRQVFSVYNDGAFYPDQRTTEITATTTRGTQTFTATKIVNVAPQGLVTHYISVEPDAATIGSTGEVQLTVLYHTVTDGVDDGGVDVTTSAGYTDNGSGLIDVNATGKVNGSGSETGGNATVTVSYPGVESVDVTVTVQDANIDYRNFRVIPLSMTLGKDDVTTGEQIQAYVDVFVNNVFSKELEVTTDAGWTSQNTNVASVSKSGTKEVVKPVYGSGYFPTTRTTTVQASYLGSAATCDVTVEPEGRIERYIEVTPSSVALGATGSESLAVKLYTKTDGVVDAGVDVTTSCSYASDSQIITVNDSGVVTANNTGETEVTANITVSYPGVDNVIVPAVSSPANIEHELLLEPQGSTTLGFEEGCTFKLYYITKINGTEVSREEVTSNIAWDPIPTEKGHMAQTTFMNEWFSTDQTTVDVCATYNGIKSNNVVLTLNGADSITYALVVTPSSNSINYNGTSQMSAEYVTYVNGTEYDRETVQPSNVSWSENSTASTISNSGLLTASNNSSAKTVTTTVTGTYLGTSGTANVTIGLAPGINVSTPSNWHLSSGAGSDEFYVKWVNLKPNTTIVLDDENIVSYSPVEIPITSSNYTGDTVTINFSYDENPNEESRKIYLYATGTGFSNETKTDSDYFEQSAKTVERNIQVSVDGKVTSNEGGTCGSLEVSWTGLTVGTWINISATNASVAPEIQVTATTGSWTLSNTPTVGANGGSSRTIGVTAQWREDTSISDTEQWTQSGGYVSPQIEVTVKDKINSNAGGNCERLTVSWTALTVGTYIDLDSLNADLPATQILVQNATDSVQWNEYPVIGQNQGNARTIAVSATWRSDNDVYDAESWTQEGNYSPTYHVWIKNNTSSANFVNDSDNPITIETFAVSIDNHYDFALTGDTSTTPIAANSNRNLNGNLTGATGTNSYQLTVSWRGDYHDDNSTVISWKETKNGVTTTRTYSESDSFETTTDIYYIDADTELSDFVVTMDSDTPAPVTYQIIFGMVTTDGTRVAGNLTYNINGGGDVAATMTPTKTVTGIPNGATVTYVMSSLSSGSWLKYSGSTVINGENQVIDGIAVPDSFKFNVRSYATPDSENNVFRIDYLTKNGANGSEAVTCISGAMETITINLGSDYVTTSDDYFRYTVTKIGGRINISGWDMTGTNGSTTNASTTALNNQYLYNINIPLGRAGNIYVSYRGTYPSPTEYTGTIYFDGANAANWSSCNILVDSTMVLEGSLAQDEGTFKYHSTGETFVCTIAGGIGDSLKYRRFRMEIVDRDGNTLWSGPCRYLYRQSIDYEVVTLTAAQLNGSTWYLYNLANYGQISIYPTQGQTGVTGNEVAGNITAFTFTFAWTGLATSSQMVVTLPENMLCGGASTITIPVNSSTDSVTRTVTIPANTGTTAGGNDIRYDLTAVATDVNSDAIHGTGYCTHLYYQLVEPIITLEGIGSVPGSYDGTNTVTLYWEDEYDNMNIFIRTNDCVRVETLWDPDTGINEILLENAQDGNGNYQIEENQTLYPEFQTGDFKMVIDITKQRAETEPSYHGRILLMGYNSAGSYDTVEIYFDHRS